MIYLSVSKRFGVLSKKYRINADKYCPFEAPSVTTLSAQEMGFCQ